MTTQTVSEILQGILVLRTDVGMTSYHVRDNQDTISGMLTDAHRAGEPEQLFYKNAKMTITIEYDDAEVMKNPLG
jgi:hypothetical protein